ncbi:MAG: sigma-54 dependent transcriptional regulator [Spirochaetes bacterium]|nr:sigma-54 dependent transcriptional regulator [Spirochaetota bacterium]
MWKVLLVDDEPQDHAILNLTLPPYFELYSCYTGQEALTVYEQKDPHFVLLDVNLPDINGIELLKLFRKNKKENPVFIMVSGYDDPEIIVEAVKSGALDYLVKPYSLETVKRILQKYLHHTYQKPSSSYLTERATHSTQDIEEFGLIGRSEAMRRIREQIHRFGPAEGTVLITGESGTGKELIAKALHQTSKRKEGPFIAINCGAVPESIFETELFGSEQGAYTDATTRMGLFEAANQGTLFLDEIGEMPLQVQVKLLRVLEEHEIRPVGSSKGKKIDVRVVSATNQDLSSAIELSRFRRDLYYRLNVFRITLPPLRERKEDIPLLAYYLLHTQQRNSFTASFCLKDQALKKLLEHSWPGNVRELKNVLERAVCLAESSDIGPELIHFY